MGEPSIDTLHDVYEDQLSAARYKAERDAAVQELKAMRERNRVLWVKYGMSQELMTCAEEKAKRLGHLVWRLQNRLARSHRREKALRKGMRMWREKAISGPVRTVSAYDLLPEEDMQTLRWVREQGGLDALKAYTDCFSNLLRECHGYRDLARDYEKRIMPEGVEWPRYESGELVQIGDEFMGKDGKTYTAKQIQFIGKCFSLFDFCDRKPQFSGFYGERVKRPEEVLAADGEPLEVGQTVWSVNDGREYKIITVESPVQFDTTSIKVDDGKAACGVWIRPDNLTHQRPALDAEGSRIEQAMDVWWICEGDERGIHAEKLYVESIGEDGMVECHPYNGGTSVVLEPSELYVNGPVLDADGVPIREGDTVWLTGEPEYSWTVTYVSERHVGGYCNDDGSALDMHSKSLTHAKPEPPDSRQAIVNEIGDEMAARIDLLVSSGRWSDAD